MSTIRMNSRAATLVAALAIAGTMVACGEDDVDVLPPHWMTAVDPSFLRYAAIGNSITAGYQSGGINDSTQRRSYAVLVAQQMRTDFVYPSLAGAGCPPPTKFVGRVPARDSTATSCQLRNPALVRETLNNVAVPGATSADPTAVTSRASNTLTTIFLGGKTQVQKVNDLNPTFVSAWIGNNDVLDAAAKGVAIPDTGAATAPIRTALNTQGITNFGTFRSNYRNMVNSLRTASGLRGILIGVVNVTNAPLLFPAESLLTNPTLKGQLDAAAGGTITVLANCAGSRALVSFAIVGQMAAGAHPRVVSCEKNVPQAPIGDFFILDTLDQAVFNTTVASYNAYIRAKADSVGFAYLNADSVLTVLKATPGNIATIPNLQSATPFGTLISFDGVHPSTPGHVHIARAVIARINSKYGTSIPLPAAP